eukprot:3736745-Heterocapsa_arctica.AAC.1
MGNFKFITLEHMLKMKNNVITWSLWATISSISNTGNFKFITLEHMTKMKNYAIVGYIVNNTMGINMKNIKLQMDRFAFL